MPKISPRGKYNKLRLCYPLEIYFKIMLIFIVMENPWFLDKFTKSADQIDRSRLSIHEMDYRVGVWLQSVCLKMQKKSWLNPVSTARPFEESIFFSIWISDRAIQESRLNYNIHALQLRELTGYSIKSREFAAAFRAQFSPLACKWPNVSVDFGPLTLMEGWISVDLNDFEQNIVTLTHQFLDISPIIDDLLLARKKTAK